MPATVNTDYDDHDHSSDNLDIDKHLHYITTGDGSLDHGNPPIYWAEDGNTYVVHTH